MNDMSKLIKHVREAPRNFFLKIEVKKQNFLIVEGLALCSIKMNDMSKLIKYVREALIFFILLESFYVLLSVC